ncbi:MAG: glycosyltransferase [Terracidiphilus sp.]|jgi:glycosyltransferase involved in cell wall biosynthesis
MQRTNLISRALGTFGSRELMVMQHPDVYAPDHEQRLLDEHNLVLSVPVTPRAQLKWGKWIGRDHPEGIDRLVRVLEHRSSLYSPDPVVHRALERLLSQRHYDLIVGRYLRATAWSGALNCPPVIVDLDDLDTQVARRHFETAPRLSPVKAVARWQLEQLGEVVPRLLSKTEHSWVSNPEDVPEVPHQHVSVLPNIPFLEKGDPGHEPIPPSLDSRVILSVGGMNQRVIPAFNQFIFNVWPKIKETVPSARYRIAGTGIDDNLKKSWGAVPGVEPIGFVSDLKDEYAGCAFTLVPFNRGGGTKIKVLESLSYGRTCLMYKHSNRGFDNILRNQESVWLANDEAEMGRSCANLLARPQLCARLGENGARHIAANYTYDSFESEVHNTLAATLDRVKRRTSDPADRALICA